MSAPERLGRKHILLRSRAMELIVTKAVSRTGAGDFVRGDDGGRVYLTPVKPYELNGYLVEYELAC